MTSLIRASVAVAAASLAIGSLDSCRSASSSDATQSSSSPITTATATSMASAASPQPAGTSAQEPLCTVYKRRCEPGCKAAHEQAVTKTCASQIKAFTSAVSNQVEFGKCLVACKKQGGDPSCVGAADQSGCDCQLKCYRQLPNDAIDMAKTSARCYGPAVSSACE